MAFTNLLAAMYPVGSVYLSTTSTSPSSTIGGTWTQVKGATLAATGANSFAGGASYGGSLKISVNQMPEHTHSANMYYLQSDTQGWVFHTANELGAWRTGYIGSTGGGQNYLPYHWGCYVWYRTA